MLGSYLTLVIFGLFVGLLARAFYPGKNKMGLILTIALGIVGSLVGGMLSWALGFRPEDTAFQGAGWILSILGACVLIGGARFIQQKTK